MSGAHPPPRGGSVAPRRPAPPGAFVAVLERRGRFLTAEPLFPPRDPAGGGCSRRGGGRMVLRTRGPGGAGRARPGDLVLVTAGARGSGANLVRVIGRPDVARNVIEALMLDRGLRLGFDPAVEREARAAGERVAGADGARRDLRELATFTIDPTGARDFDDAISAQALADGGARVWVHIADVAAHVPEGSPLDREARRRATSVYVPGAVEPMLPHALSSGACSLQAGTDRTAVTVLDIVGPLGHPSEIKNFGTAVILAGSVGTAMALPTAYALKHAGNHVVFIEGSRNKEMVVFEDEVRSSSSEAYVMTDDGSYGEQGLVTKKLDELIAAGRKIDFVLAVGPVPMMRAVARITAPLGIKTMVSLNSIMVDGTGMCGGCRVLLGDKSKFACVDGPEFDASRVNFEVLMQRNAMYREKECAALKEFDAHKEEQVAELREELAAKETHHA